MEAGDYERCLVACMVQNPRLIDQVVSMVAERDFEDDILRKAFKTLVLMRDAGDEIGDTAVLAPKLANTGLSTVEIFELVNELQPLHLEYHAKKIREAGRLRRMKVQLAKIMDMVGHEDTDETVGRIQDLLQDCHATQSFDFASLSDSGKALIEVIEQDKQSSPSCFSGIGKVDDVIGGFKPGELIIIGARPGIGKSSLAMQFAMHNAMRGRAGLFISLEMTKTELAGRVFCGLTETDAKHLRCGTLSKDEIFSIMQKIDELADLKLFLWDPSAANIHKIQAVSRLAKIRHDIQFLAVDYIGLVDSVERGMKRHEHIGEVSRRLKQLAKELEVPVFALSQLNRDADGQEPMLSNLRDSGSVEQDADAIIFIHPRNDSDRDAGEIDLDDHIKRVKLIVAKHRHGERGCLKIYFNEKKTEFMDSVVPLSEKVDQLPAGMYQA